MPKEVIDKNPMPLWNVAQEIHTGRIYQFFMGDFYILVVPLTGLFTLYLNISGFIIWYKRYRKKKRIANSGERKTENGKRRGAMLAP
jgi:uncharacterized iron-regulated membrane protein